MRHDAPPVPRPPTVDPETFRRAGVPTASARRTTDGWPLVLLLTFWGFLLRPAPGPTGSDERDHVGFLGDYRLPHVQCAFRRLGLRWARVDFRWDQIEPTRDVFDWTGPDSLVRTAHALGLRLMVNLWGTPPWANGGQPPNVPPTDAQDWQDFVRAVVLRYSRWGGSDFGVRHWLIWNEPNLKKFFTGTPDDYVDRILVPAARTIHALDPTAQVGAPEVTHHWLREWPRWNVIDVLHRARPYIDIITHHALARPDEVARVVDDVMYPVLRSMGWIGRPFWLTEVGWDTCDTPCGLDWQAHAYRWTLEYRQARSDWLQMVVFFVMWTGRACYHDVLMADFTCENERVRPAFRAVLDFLQGRPFDDPFPACHGTADPCGGRPDDRLRPLLPECRPRGP